MRPSRANHPRFELKILSQFPQKQRYLIGVSGGLDSTHALIVAAKAMDRLERPRSDILAFTMPGFAKFRVVKKPATKARQGINPFTKAPTTFAAKPASKSVRARPIKSIKDAVA